MLSEEKDFSLKAGIRYGVAISWDEGNSVDVDLQAVIVDDKGQVIEAVYYNNLKALKFITHSGDEQTGEKQGFDEIIWITFPKAPSNVKMILFVVAAHQGGNLRDVINGKIHVVESRNDNEVACVQMEKSECQVDIVAVMVKTESGDWVMRIVDEDAQEGQHFIDILEPTLGSIIRKEIPNAPKKLKVAFAMEKGSAVALPMAGGAAMKAITAGLGWDTDQGSVDVDVSAVLFDSYCRHRDAIFFGNLEAHGIQHSGDNLTGEGDGDDEKIYVDLGSLPDWAVQIFFVVNVYTKGRSFQNVANPYCRIIDSTGQELARYELREAGDQRGLIIARLIKDQNGRWTFQAIGSFCRGQTWKDAVVDMEPIAQKTTTALQPARTATQAGLSAPPLAAAAPPPPAAATAAAEKPSKLCVVQ